MVARYLQRAIELGPFPASTHARNESYKYAWGAVDEPIERLLVQRTVGGR